MQNNGQFKRTLRADVKRSIRISLISHALDQMDADLFLFRVDAQNKLPHGGDQMLALAAHNIEHGGRRLERIDKLASLGLPIKVTEFDVGDWQAGMNDTEEVQAQKFETFIRTAFSHPAVNGIVLWGFWDNRHWVKNGGMIASDGREKPAAKRVYDLWHKVWTTDLTVTADAKGVAKFRGFKGEYQVEAGSKKFQMTVK